MPTPRGIPLVLALTIAATTAALGACSGDDGPTVEEAGTQLAADGRELMNGGSMLNVEITEAADENIPCDDGKAKRVFKATADVDMGADTEVTLDNATGAANGFLAQRGYDFPEDLDELPTVSDHEFTMVNEELEISFHVEIKPRPRGYLVDAETACLRIE